MNAMRFPRIGQAEIVDVPIPAPQSNEVLVKVRAAGICASDVAAFKGTHHTRRPPVITGHELAGEIVAAGSDVTTRRSGDRVAIEPHLGCGQCPLCRQGHYHICPSKRFLGVGDWIGAFAEYVVAAEAMCHPIPDAMSWEEGAALEPLCVGLHAVRRCELRLGETVAVLGAGTIGMMTILAARWVTPRWMVATDISAAKRDLAVRCGATLALDPRAEDPVAETLKATDGVGADAVFVAVSAHSALEQAGEMCRRMGRLVIIASFFEGGALDPRPIQTRERTVMGTSMYTADDYRLAIRLWEEGHLSRLPEMITERITIDEGPAVVAALARGERPDNIKTIIRFD